MPTDQSRPSLYGLLLIFLLCAAGLSALIPLGEAADEVSHQSYVRYVAEYGGLPPVVPDTTVFGETFQPPLYYALVAPLTAWLPTGPDDNLGFAIPVENNPDWELGNPDRARVLLQPATARWVWQGEALGWHLVRFVSVLLGVVTVYFTYRLAQVVWQGEAWTAWLAAAFVALLPSFLGVSAAVTNDSLATALSAVLLCQLATLAVTDKGNDTKQWIIAGVLGALGVWTKASGWLFVGTTILAALWWAVQAGRPAAQRWRDAFLRLCAAGGAWLVVVAPLTWINLQRGGDLLGQSTQSAVTDARTQLTLTDLGETLYSLYRTWWAGFGGAVHLSFPWWVNALLALPLLLAGVGLLRRHLQRQSAPVATQRLIPFIALHIVLVGVAWIGWTQLVLGTGQGRLLFPALPAIATLVAGGWTVLVPNRERVSAWVAAGGMVMLFLLAVGTILLPVYRAPHTPEPQPVEAVTGRWQVGDTALTLTSFYLPWTVDSRITPGTVAPLYLGWESTAPLPDLRVRLRWIDRDGNAVGAAKEGSPIANHPLTDEWTTGHYAATHHVRLPDNIEPGYYRLMLSVIDATTGQPLPLRGEEGGAGDEIMVGQTTVVE